MIRQLTKGKCGYCPEVFESASMTKHLQSCKVSPYKEGAAQKTGNQVFLIKASGKGLSDYWLFFEASGNATLENLDLFLRDTWLECCGHLSLFDIGGIQFYSDKESAREFDGMTMNVPLKSVLKSGTIFQHEYDFGTTTELKLQVIAARSGMSGKDAIKFVTMNDPPVFICGCGKTATEVCAQCIYERKALFCSDCMKKHKCGEEMALPIVNSPRAGMCGYTG